MKKFLTTIGIILLFLVAIVLSAHAATISVQSNTLTGFNGSSASTYELWVFSDREWVDVDGNLHGAGNTTNKIWTQRVTGLTYNNSAKTLTIPTFNLISTRDALRGNNVRLTFWIMTVSGNSSTSITQVPGTNIGLTIPASITSATPCTPTPTCASFADLISFNSPAPPLPPDTYYTATVVDQKIAAAITGGNAPAGASYITRTAEADLSNETRLDQFSNGAILKHSGSGNLAAASAEVDYVTPTGAGILNNKTLTTPTIASFVNATHDHSSASGGGTVSHLSLSNIGSNSHAQIDTFIASKAAASGLASLDGSSLVVQNPANAQTTPAASKIPLADGSNKLAAGWISEVLGVADLTDFNGKSGSGTTAIGATITSATLNDALLWDGSKWVNSPIPGASHAILSATHTDSTAASVTRGGLIVGKNASPKWELLTIGSANRYLSSDGTDVSWAQISLTAGVTGTLPIASGGTNSTTALNNNRIMVSSAGGIIEAAALTDGQLLIGSTGAAPVAASLTAGSNITITPSAGGITIAATGALGVATIEEEGTPLTQRDTVNFVGNGITAADSGGKTVVTVTDAGAATPGVVTAGAQTFGGAKTFATAPILTGFTTGSIFFSNSGTVTQDNSNLFYDDTNNRLGILTTSPDASLSVADKRLWDANGRHSLTSYTAAYDQATNTLSYANQFDAGTQAIANGAAERQLDVIRILGTSSGGTALSGTGFANLFGINLEMTNSQSDGTSTGENGDPSRLRGIIGNFTTTNDGSVRGIHMNAIATGTATGFINGGAFTVTPVATSIDSWGVQIHSAGVTGKSIGLTLTQESSINWLYGIDTSDASYDGAAIRLGNTHTIAARNAADSADFNMLAGDATDSTTIRNSTAIKFGTNTMGTEYARFNSSGDLLIGHTASLGRLSVYNGNAAISAADNSGAGKFFEWRYSRGTLVSPLATTNGDTFGVFRAYGHDGTNPQIAGQMGWSQDGTASAGIVPGFLNIFIANDSGALVEAARFTKTQKAFFGNGSGGGVGIGTTTTDGRPLLIDSAFNALAAGEASMLVHGQANKERIEVRSYANQPTLQFRRAQGTQALPTATASTNIVGAVGAGGYDGTAFTGIRARIDFVAGENYTATAQGTAILFNTTPTGSTTVREVGRFHTTGLFNSFKGADVASAASITLTGNVQHITGTTNITSIDTANMLAGTVVTLIFDDVLTFTDGSNLVLAGNFVTTANDSITLVFDGTNMVEVCRSVN